MKTGISLLTMGAGNVLVLRKTLESFSKICDEVIYGDLLIWEEDREIIKSYQEEFNVKIITFPFNYIFKNGFSALLNELASHASNDFVMYMNTSEVIDEDYGIVDTVNNNYNCNAFYFIHRTEGHRWFRIYNRHQLKWSGRIHEQLSGEYNPYHKPIFMMMDLEKDMDNPYKAKIFNLVKEYVYFEQYVKIVDNPELLGETDAGWLSFARADYTSFKERLVKRTSLYTSFKIGNMYLFWHSITNDPEFKSEQFKSSNLIAFQGDKIHLL